MEDLNGSYSHRCHEGVKFPPITRSEEITLTAFTIELLQQTLRTSETEFQCRTYGDGIFINGTPRGHANSKSTGLYSRQSSFFETKDHPSRIGQFSHFWMINNQRQVALATIFPYKRDKSTNLPIINLDTFWWEVILLSNIGNVVVPAVPRIPLSEIDRVTLGCSF